MSTNNHIDHVRVSEGSRNMTKGVLTKDEVLGLEQERVGLSQEKNTIENAISSLNQDLDKLRFKKGTALYNQLATTRKQKLAQLNEISNKLAGLTMQIKAAKSDATWNDGSRIMEKLRAIETRMDSLDRSLARLFQLIERMKT